MVFAWRANPAAMFQTQIVLFVGGGGSFIKRGSGVAFAACNLTILASFVISHTCICDKAHVGQALLGPHPPGGFAMDRILIQSMCPAQNCHHFNANRSSFGSLKSGGTAFLGGALAGQKILYTVWGQIQWLEKVVYTSRFSVIFQNFQNCRQITATPRRSIFHAAKSSQMPYKAQNQKITYFHNKI
jgi:hypothetical protein